MKSKEIIEKTQIGMKKDVYRETPMRFMGYAPEIVRALGCLFQFSSGILHLSYGVSATYACADVIDKSLNESKKKGATNKDIADMAQRTLLWQTFASFVFPRYVIDKISRTAVNFARYDLRVPTQNGRALAGLIGLALIPLVVTPIDDLVNVMGLNPNHPQKKVKMKENKGYDIYRDSLLRYMGYCNEVGEAFRPLVPGYMVKLSYGLSMGYVLADTFDKSGKIYEKPGSTTIDVAKKGGDVLIWQTFASVVIPGFTINRITKLTRLLVKKVPNSKFIPTAIGLASIPLIVKPIDHLVDYLMDQSYRKYFNVE